MADTLKPEGGARTDWYLPITCFLLRRGTDPPRAFANSADSSRIWQSWADGQTASIDDPTQIEPAVTPTVIVSFSHPSSPPMWLNFLTTVAAVPLDEQYGTVSGAVVFCAVTDATRGGGLRWTAWAFGSASRTLDRQRLEPRFGLYVALNRLSRSSGDDLDELHHELAAGLRQLQFRTPSPYSIQTGQRAGRDIPVQGFRLDHMVDLISGVGGRAGQDDDQVFGARQLRLRRRLGSIDDLTTESEMALQDFRSTDYLKEFSFVDSMVAVEDPDEIARLEPHIVAALRDRQSDRVDVFYPDDLIEFGDERTITYIAYPHERKASHGRTTLTIGMVRKMAEDDPDGVLHRPLRFLDASGDEVGTVSVLACLAADIINGSDRYVLYDGTFFRVDDTFIASVDREVDALAPSQLAMPPFLSGSEPPWNRSFVADNPGTHILIDTRLVRPAGQTPFEPCDVTTTTGALIHVKRKGRSSALSHLFTQALRSTELLSRDAACRSELFDLINKHALSAQLANQVIDALSNLIARPPNLEVCFALLGEWTNRTPRSLPLLSKIDLVSSCQRLDQLGFRPTVALVGSSGNPGVL